MVLSTVLACAAGALVTLWVLGFRPEELFEAARPSTQPPVVRSSTVSSAPRPAVPKALDPTVAFPGIKSASESPHRLILTGTLPGRNSREGTAFIGIDLRNPQTYVAGAVLANGTRLTQVFRDYVVLERDGHTALLYLTDRASRSSPDTGRDLLMVGGPSPVAPAKPTSAEQFTDYIRPSPIYDGPTLRGYGVYAGAQGSVFSQLGLQPGDIITAVDGVPFVDPTQAMEMFRQLASGVAMRTTISRKGQLQDVALDGSLIVAAQERAQTWQTGMALAGDVPRT